MTGFAVGYKQQNILGMGKIFNLKRRLKMKS
jgi:hypothetical protein